MSVAAAERTAAGPRLRPVERADSRPLLGVKVLLPAIYLLALLYHWLQGRGHVTPAVFGDELLYSKLAQSIAAGDGFTVRGEPVFFPAPLAVLAQAPAWLFDATPTAYAAAKTINAAVMSAAVFPAYALARRLVRPSFALLVAAAAVAGPPMLYHAYLMSEALAYPVFLLACATMLRAIAQPSRRMELAVVGVSLAACMARLQFVVVPLAYLVGAPLAGKLAGQPFRAVVRRHRLSLGALFALVALPLVTGGAVLGTYFGATVLDYEIGDIVWWSAITSALLPFAAGGLVVPGALLGLFLLAARPQGRAQSGFAALALALGVFVLLEIGLIGAGEGKRAIERYEIYLVPLLFIAFFAYVERGAPGRRLYGALALAGAATAWLMPFPAWAGNRFTFDSPTFSVYAQLATWWGHANAATIMAGVPLLGGIALALLPLRRPRAPLAVGLASILLLALSGIPAYAGDHRMARGTLLLRAGDPPDWLDRSGLGPADYLQLPGGSAHYGWVLETWNRSFRRGIQLGLPKFDYFASWMGRIDRDGRLLVDGQPPQAGILIVNDFGTAIELEGAEVVARPREGLTAYRIPAGPRVRSLAMGVCFDRWATPIVRYQVWPERPSPRGFYRVSLALPEGVNARKVTLAVDRGARRTFEIGPGETRLVRVPARGHPVPVLRISTERADFVGGGTANARLVSVLIPSISYVSDSARP